ncbi:MAG: aspartate 1-decarboxylase [Deltaproteobacteria bacterium]|nr:aspartate 1-decarboxylase [Deltaproteobacteria bacterium]
MFSRRILIGKIHRATVTGADVDYMGSITIDPVLLEESGILPLEEVEVWDLTNGERLSTYTLPGEPGDGQVMLNGAAARKVVVGDKVIISAYGQFDGDSLGPHVARVVFPDENNAVSRTSTYRVDLKTREFELRDER